MSRPPDSLESGEVGWEDVSSVKSLFEALSKGWEGDRKKRFPFGVRPTRDGLNITSGAGAEDHPTFLQNDPGEGHQAFHVSS